MEAADETDCTVHPRVLPVQSVAPARLVVALYLQKGLPARFLPMPSTKTLQNLRVPGSKEAPRLERGVILAASVRRCGLRWLTALLDSHPRSVCRSDPLERTYTPGLLAGLRRL